MSDEVYLTASYRRVASDGDYGFNRPEAKSRKQYAEASSTGTHHQRSHIYTVVDLPTRTIELLSFFNGILKKWRENDNFFDSFLMSDEVWAKSLELSRVVYEKPKIIPSSSNMPSVMADSGSILAANLCSFLSAIEEKCRLFMGLPERVSLLKKRLTVHAKSPGAAALLYKSKLFTQTIADRAKSRNSVDDSLVDAMEERFKRHVPFPFRPSLFERFGNTASEEEIDTTLGGAKGTFSASNTHGKTLMHFARVACNRGFVNTVGLPPLDNSPLVKSSTARALLVELFVESAASSVRPHDTDAALLYGNGVDCKAFSRLIDGGLVTHGIEPEDFTRDMERTPFFEMRVNPTPMTAAVKTDRYIIDEISKKMRKTTETVNLKVNAGQLLCDMVFGSDWDVHLKDYLSITGYEAFNTGVHRSGDESKGGGLLDKLNNMLLDGKRMGEVDVALVLASNHIKKVADAEMKRLASDPLEEVFKPTSLRTEQWSVSDHVKVVVGHLFKEMFTEGGLKRICDRLFENYGDGIPKPADGELEAVTANLFFAKMVDSMHLLRNQDISRVCYNIEVGIKRGTVEDALRGYTDGEGGAKSNKTTSVQMFRNLRDVPSNSVSGFFQYRLPSDAFVVSWDATNRRVVAVTRNVKLASMRGEDIDDRRKRVLASIKSYPVDIKSKVGASRMFNYRAMYDAVKAKVDFDGSPPIKHRFFYDVDDEEEAAQYQPQRSAPVASSNLGSAAISAGFFYSSLRDALERGFFRGASQDVKTTLNAMAEDATILQASRPEEIALRDLVSTSLAEESTAVRFMMKEDVHGVETVAFKEGGDSLLDTLRDLKSNKVTLSEAAARMGIRTDMSMDLEFAKEMETTYPDGAIDRWEKMVGQVENYLPSSQVSKLEEIERELNETTGVISDEEIARRVNDTELSKATDSILKRSLGGGFKIMAGRFVAIAITGTVLGVLGKATADVMHASRGAHYNVKDASTGELKSYKILRFSCFDHSKGGDYLFTHPFEDAIDETITTDDDFETPMGAYVYQDVGKKSNFRAHAPICGEEDKKSGPCGRWAHYWSGSVLPWLKPMDDLVEGTSLTCDKGLSVVGAASEVLGSAATKILGKIIEASIEVAEEATSGVFDLIINSPAFIAGVPIAAGIASAGLDLANWKRGLAVVVAVLVLILFLRFFVGSGCFTLKWFRGESAEDTKGSRLGALMSNYTEEDKNRIADIGGVNRGSSTGEGIKDVADTDFSTTTELKNFEVIRPLFGPARPSQEMTYFHVGLLY